MTTAVLYGKKANQQDWEYVLITDKRDDFDKAKEWAMNQGYTTFITRDIEMAIAPDFSKVVA